MLRGVYRVFKAPICVIYAIQLEFCYKTPTLLKLSKATPGYFFTSDGKPKVGAKSLTECDQHHQVSLVLVLGKATGSGLPAWITLRQDALPNQVFLCLIHPNPVSHLLNGATTATADVIKGC